MKSKFLYVFFAVTALLCCFIFSASAGYDIDTDNILELDQVDSLYECLATGDVDNNGKIEASDARVILRVSVNLDEIDTSAFMKADVDGDGKITAQDARLALRLSVGLDKLPEHNLESFIIVPATCKTEGLTVKVCTSCVKIYAQITEPASDEYHIPGAWETIEKNTCVKEGLAQIKCCNCGEVVKELKLPATRIHSLTEWTYPEGKNCERDMPKVRGCKDCDYTEKGIEHAGHDYKYVEVQKKTCVQDGIEIYKCVDCGKEGVDSNGKTVYTYKAPGKHHFEENATVLKEPTCTETGIAAYLCIYCDAPQTEIVLPANGHKYDRYYKVTNEPTCTETGTADAVCEVCGEEKEIVLDMIEHDINEKGWTVTLAPTCTEEGEKEGYCRYCRADVTVTVPANGHSITTWENVKPATCTEAGLKKGICSVCGDTGVTEETEKLPHSFDRNTKYWYEGVPCKEPWKYYNKCTVCGEKEYYLTYKIKDCTSIKNGERQTRVVTAATCTEAETVVEVCIYCKEDISKVRTNGKPLGHEYADTDWTVTKTPNCTESGTKKAACARNCGTITEEVIPAKGHSFTNYISDGNTTCTLSGTKTAICDHGCGEANTVKEMAEGHKFINYISDNNATCTKDGTKTATCENGCGATHSIAGDKATGHSFTNYISDDNTTCTSNGTKTAVCDNGCGAFDVIVEPGAGHTPGEFTVTQSPSCSVPGTETSSCTVCGEVLETRDIPTLPHTPEEVIIAGSGETDENGNYIVKCKTECSVCGETIGEESTIEILSVKGDFSVKFTEFEGANAGDKFSFTVDNGDTDIIVMISYGKDNSILLEETNGEYTFAIPEGLSAEDQIFIIVLTLN